MCIECSLGATFCTMLCVKDRKVWKKGHSLQFAGRFCPTCGEEGKDMGFRWRAPRLTNKSAWARIEAGDYLWERPRSYNDDEKSLNLTKKKPAGLGRYIPLAWRQGMRRT